MKSTRQISFPLHEQISAGIVLLMTHTEILSSVRRGAAFAIFADVASLDVYESALTFAANETGYSESRCAEIVAAYFTVYGAPASWASFAGVA